MMDYFVMETQLNGEYREVFSKAALYGTMKNIPEDICDEKMSELYDLLLTAESEGKPVRKLVGSDVNKFCKDFFSDLTIWDRLKTIPTSLYRVAWIIFVIECIEVLAADNPIKNFFSIKSDISGYTVGIITALLMYFITESVLAPIFLKNKNGKNTEGWYLLILAFFAVLTGLGVHFFGEQSIIVPTWTFIFASGAYILVYLIIRSVWRLKNYGSLRNTRKKIEQDSYYKNLQNKDMEKAILKGWGYRYNNLMKKGRTTEEGYLGKLQKEERLLDKFIKFGIPVLFAVVSLFFIVNVALDDGTWYDALIFTAIIGSIDFVFARWIIRSEKKQAAIRTRLLNECAEKGMTMPEYIEYRFRDS